MLLSQFILPSPSLAVSTSPFSTRFISTIFWIPYTCINIQYMFFSWNANQKYNEVSPHTSQNGHHQKIYKQQMLESMWNQCSRELSCTVDGSVNWYSHYGKLYEDSLKNSEIFLLFQCRYFTAIGFPLSTAFAVSHMFWYVAFSFSFILKYFLNAMWFL